MRTSHGSGRRDGLDPLDPHQVRRDFPALRTPGDAAGPETVFFDNAATAQKPAPVLRAIQAYYRQQCAPVARSTYRRGREAGEQYETGRRTVATYLGARSHREVVFTPGTTAALTMLAHGLASWIGPGDRILVSLLEHHANLLPWQRLARQRGAELHTVPLTPDGDLDDAALDRLLDQGCALMAVTHMSNVLGTINPLDKLAARVHAAGGLLIVDGAQGAVHDSPSVLETDCDFYVFSGHKLYGPEGIGVLYGKYALLEQLDPLFVGGGMVRRIEQARADWFPPPAGLEGGSPHVAGVLGLAAAVAYLQGLGRERVAAHETRLITAARERLAAVPGLQLQGKPQRQGPVFSFNLEGIHAHDVAAYLEAAGVEVRAGRHCCQPLLDSLGLTASLRISLALYNSEQEIAQVCRILTQAREFFRP